MQHILYNPHAGQKGAKAEAELVTVFCKDAILTDMTTVKSYADWLAGISPEDSIVITGGDGTLNRFLNDTRGLDIPNKIYYHASGSGNDFARELGDRKADPAKPVSTYFADLPTVTVHGKEHLFLNGVGYGIDGYCCEVGDKLRAENASREKKKPINYTAIAIKGLLFHYKPREATVTVDGKKYTYSKVWLTPTMHGKYYGGGMIPTPGQDRTAEEKTLSVLVMHGAGRLKTLLIFPSIFKGEHVGHTKYVDVLRGKEITVEYDIPAPLQIDGETILNVSSYTAKTADRRDPARRSLPRCQPFSK